MTHVLLVDDDPLSLRILERHVSGQGYEVTLARGGWEALEAFDRAPPDVVFLDVVMPDLDGFEVARRIRMATKDRYIPIIFLTSLHDAEDIRSSYDAGADDVLTKPFSRHILDGRIKAALRTKALFEWISDQKRQLEDLVERSRLEMDAAGTLMSRLTATEGMPFLKYVSRPMGSFNGDILIGEVTRSGNYRVMLGDCAGHGLTAAIAAMPVATSFRAAAREGASVLEFLDRANREVHRFLSFGMFVALCVLELEWMTGRVEIFNAGLPPVLIRGKDGTIRHRIESAHLPLGILFGVEGLKSTEVSLSDGERIYLYSDGVTEATNADREPFGQERLERAITQAPRDSDVFNLALEELANFVGATPAQDDQTFIELAYGPLARDVLGAGPAPEPSPKISVVLNARQIRDIDAGRFSEHLAESLNCSTKQRGEIELIIRELLINAIDHGVLRLDSAVKRDVSGFMGYYVDRERRLAELEHGWIRVEVAVVAGSDEDFIELEIEDSGPGFGTVAAPGPLAGRGLELVRSLCAKVEHLGRKNVVRASYALSRRG